MKTILLPTDFSKNSLNAIDFALDMSKDCVCEFILLNIQKASSFISDDLRTMSPDTTVYETLISSSKTALNELVIKLEARRNYNHRFTTLVDYDNFVDAINQACSLKNVDLIIMGTQGATGAEKIIFGSNTVRVMQRGNRPVLAIPSGYKYNGMDKIAFTSNYHTDYNPEELMPLLILAELYEAKIDILHLMEEQGLSEEQKKNKEKLDHFFKFVNHEFVDLESKGLFESVNEFLEKNNTKMLAMMSRKHSFLERLFTEHAVETFGYKLNIPLLVMENTAEYY